MNFLCNLSNFVRLFFFFRCRVFFEKENTILYKEVFEFICGKCFSCYRLCKILSRNRFNSRRFICFESLEVF